MSATLIPRMQSVPEKHPGGWVIHRGRRGWPKRYQRWLEVWWVITDQWSLHRAWQAGHDQGTAAERHRTVVMGGR